MSNHALSNSKEFHAWKFNAKIKWLGRKSPIQANPLTILYIFIPEFAWSFGSSLKEHAISFLKCTFLYFKFGDFYVTK